jgi:quercetin dioxygenase-like cupin family protein
MQFERGRVPGPSFPGPATITGDMAMDTRLKAENLGVNGVVFQPGARTYWHSHTHGQIFLVSFGRGIVGTRDGHQVIEAGDVLYTPPGEEHWHGATPDSFVAYTAISLGTTVWGEELSESDYRSCFCQDGV